jgi:formylglycine-generating enzyme required for sulfatase activity/proteasome lid subunit RPN8/RPN11
MSHELCRVSARTLVFTTQVEQHGGVPLGAEESVRISLGLYNRLVGAVRSRLPRKSFGYLISEVDGRNPSDFILFETNIRNEPDWKGEFEGYGRYFVAHPDAGFVATPEETWMRHKETASRGMFEVGVFHSHQRHPANFSRIDYDMHLQRFPTLWHLIISMRNPHRPELRIFAMPDGRVHEVPLHIGPPGSGYVDGSALGPAAKHEVISSAREVLQLDRRGRPRIRDAHTIMAAIEALTSTGNHEAIAAILVDGFLRDRNERYARCIAPFMRSIPGRTFLMGTPEPDLGHFYGESPRHAVELSAFDIMQVPVTNELYSWLDDRYDVSTRDRRIPVVKISWYEACLFAMWMDCRLPTEAEWELSCGAHSVGQWCCDDEAQLRHYAWYSENAGDMLQPVATREPNAFEIFDLHGNVWEWCQDVYDQDYYRRSPMKDPVNDHSRATPGSDRSIHRVTRGGSMLSLAEMCRTRFRFHERPHFFASDLGFRLARSNHALMGDDTNG